MIHLLRLLLLVSLAAGTASAQTRVLPLTTGRSAAEATALTAYRANPLTLRIKLDASRPTATGLESITAEVRRSLTDNTSPLASVTISTPTGAGPFTLAFSGAQLNQDLAGKPSRQFWLVVYSSADAGATLDIWHAGKFTLLEHGASQTAAAPPNVVGPLSRPAADALYATLATVASLTARVEDLEDDVSSAVAGGVILRRNGMEDAFYPPLEYSDAGRGTALRTALITAQLTPLVPATVELRRGRFALAEGSTLLSANPAINCGVRFGPDSALVYAEPDDAATDYKFFTGPRNVVNFGAVAVTGTDNLSAFQAAANSLETLYADPPLTFPESGRWLRTGAITIPVGGWELSGTWEVSPTVTISGAGTNSTVLYFRPNSAPSPSAEVFMIDFPVPTGVFSNNLFGTGVRDLSLSGQRNSGNSGGSGIRLAGGQGTHLAYVNIGEFGLRGAKVDGGSFRSLWIVNITRGPGLEWSTGGKADMISVEHVNPNGAVDGAGLIYPAVAIGNGGYQIDLFGGEEGAATPQTMCRATDVLSLVIGSQTFGVAQGTTRDHTLLDIRGTSTGVVVGHIHGVTNGVFPIDPGTLVKDTSTGSPSGSGLLYTLDGSSGNYRQDNTFPRIDVRGPSTMALTNSDSINAGGAGAHLNLTNDSYTGQSSIISQIGGVMRSKWRTDYLGNANWIANGGGHYFYTGGDFPVGTAKLILTPEGYLILPGLPQSPGDLPDGALWHDTTDNVIRVAP